MPINLEVSKKWHAKALELRNRGLNYKEISNIIHSEFFPSEQFERVRKRVKDYLGRNKKKIVFPFENHEKKEQKVIPFTSSAPNSLNPLEKTTTSKTGDYETTESTLVLTSDRKEMIESGEDGFLHLHGYDPALWEVVSSKHSLWQAQSKDGLIEMCSSKISVKKREKVNSDEVLVLYKKMLGMNPQKHTPVKKYVKDAENIAILTVADLHLGKLGWDGECGENYNGKIAKTRFFHIINESIDLMKIKQFAPEKIVFFWSQDFFHFDTVEITTTAGTRQDTDTRWQKNFADGTNMLISAIKMLSEVAPVTTFYTRPNHDEQTGFYAVATLAARFYDDPNVEVDFDVENVCASPRKYVSYGVNLMGFGHGDKEGKRIENMMQIEAAPAWGASRYREWFLGHFHSMRYYEKGGIIFRYLQSPTGTDSWHSASGFIGAQKSAQLFIRNKYKGPIGEFPILIPDKMLFDSLKSNVICAA